MLSRVAENLYWYGRYLERAEDLGRLINVNGHLMLDLPRKMAPGWAPLIRITGSQSLFDELFDDNGERQVVRFLLAEPRHSGSVLSCLNLARENLRAARDLLPREVWEQTNDLCLTAQAQLAGNLSKRRRQEFIDLMIRRCQQLIGMLSDIMSHDYAWDFILLGRYHERADMTTRILDVRSAHLLRGVDDIKPFDQLQWMSVLKSLTAYQMYRRHVRLRVRGPDVLRFLLGNPLFPRSVVFCLEAMAERLEGLPEHEDTLVAVGRLKRLMDQADPEVLVQGQLSEFLDRIQLELIGIGESITQTWFRVQPSE
ncbi:MAG: alpha-E domain-containing protein [Wenzhouxiangella sp.]|nr:MAG: alpha-E domain-containing protein [Wenzhouxiangella sp.]